MSKIKKGITPYEYKTDKNYFQSVYRNRGLSDGIGRKHHRY